MTLRLTSSNFAGTFRNDVAVGTLRLRSMLDAIAAAAPRIGSPWFACVWPAGPVCPDSRTAGAAACGGGGAGGAGVAGTAVGDATPLPAAGGGVAGGASAAAETPGPGPPAVA